MFDVFNDYRVTTSAGCQMYDTQRLLIEVVFRYFVSVLDSISELDITPPNQRDKFAEFIWVIRRWKSAESWVRKEVEIGFNQNQVGESD